MSFEDLIPDSHMANTLTTESSPQHPPFPIPLSTPTHRDEDTLGIFAATLNSGHTLVVKHHIVRFTDTALLAG